MKIVHIIPGSGGTFYCQNCMRDNELIRALKSAGHDVRMVPMYLPLNVDIHGIMGDTPVFYGAINVYLKEKLPLYRHAPVWLERLFDSESVLQKVARRSGSTRAEGLEEMTLSMLRGEKGRQSSELEHLIHYLQKEIQPDVVHLSNALLLGLAKRLRNDLGVAIVCSLQDENEWIDPMRSQYQEQVWDLMAERAQDVHAFVAASQYYADRSVQQMKLDPARVKVVYGGVNLDGYVQSDLPMDPPVIGYLCRMSEYFGLGLVVDAFIELKRDSRFSHTQLWLTGGYTGDDKPFIDAKLAEAREAGVGNDIRVWEEFDRQNRIKFLQSLTLLSVPVLNGEAFGAYQVEALAAGVPIVQPNVGGYAEFVENTGGGLIYEPNTAEQLSRAWKDTLSNPDQIKTLGFQGRARVLQEFSMQRMANDMINVYQDVLSERKEL